MNAKTKSEPLPGTEISMPDVDAITPETAAAFFSGDNAERLVSNIEQRARALIPDTTTPEGRKAIASNAYKIARSKTFLDGLGKRHVAGVKAQVKAIDAIRKMIRERFDALRDEIRDPLNKIEAAEKAHEAEIKARIDAFSAPWPAATPDIEARLAELEGTEIDISFSKFIVDAAEARDAAIVAGRAALADAKAADERARLQAERERKEAERRARELVEEKERLAAQARAEAKAEAEAEKTAMEIRHREELETARREARAAAIREETRVPVTAESLKSMEDALAPEKSGPGDGGHDNRPAVPDPGPGPALAPDPGQTPDPIPAQNTPGTTPEPLPDAGLSPDTKGTTPELTEIIPETVEQTRERIIEQWAAAGIMRADGMEILEMIEAGECDGLIATYV